MISLDKPHAKCLSILGTGSDVGKSIVVTALCRIFRNMGIHVTPYKAQNMSNNSYVTMLGGEIGRAQVVQAEAARVPIHVDMNPVLLKPSTDTGSQVVLHGKVIGNIEASEYFANTTTLYEKAKESLNRLRSEYDLVVMEGAGSCAEVNLQDRDFVNFRMAHAADAPVILTADIDRGGVFAQLIGTLAVIPPENRQRIKGFIINRFRGDATLFTDGIDYIEKQTGIPVLGLIPYYYHIDIDAEDGLPLSIIIDPPNELDSDSINIAVLRLPHISNFTDFAPLQRESSVTLHYLSKPRSLNGYDTVILPGTKNVRFDLDWMKELGWNEQLIHYTQNGGHLCGICGGYQMLGNVVLDPHGVEGNPGETKGLGSLNLETTLSKEKTLSCSSGIYKRYGQPVEGYEIHMGATTHVKEMQSAILVNKRNGSTVNDDEGVMSSDGKIWGTYFHGLFDNSGFRCSFLEGLKPESRHATNNVLLENEMDFKHQQYDLLAKHFRDYLDMDKLIDIVGIDLNQNR